MAESPVVPPIRTPRKFIIEGVLPAHVVALLVGPPGVGKSSAALGWLSDISQGLPVFAKPTVATHIVVVSCDRSEDEYYSHLDALKIPREQFSFFDQSQSPTTIPIVVKACASRWPGSLIFIEGFALLVPDVNLKDYGVVARFLLDGAALARQYGVTILGCVHAPKEKDGQGYADPRSQIAGSMAWSAFSNLTVVIQKKDTKDPQDPVRLVHVLTRASAGDFTLVYQKDPDSPGGAFIPYENIVEKELLDFFLLEFDFEQNIARKEFLDYASTQNISVRAAERWLEQQANTGRLERVKRGVYRRLRLA